MSIISLYRVISNKYNVCKNMINNKCVGAYINYYPVSKFKCNQNNKRDLQLFYMNGLFNGCCDKYNQKFSSFNMFNKFLNNRILNGGINNIIIFKLNIFQKNNVEYKEMIKRTKALINHISYSSTSYINQIYLLCKIIFIAIILVTLNTIKNILLFNPVLFFIGIIIIIYLSIKLGITW